MERRRLTRTVREVATGAAGTAQRVTKSSQRRERRGRIVAALRASMLERGYTDTTLTDIAKGADLTVSHLLYYYPSKDSVLLDLSNEIMNSMLDEITVHADQPVEEQIHVLVENLFMSSSVRRLEMGIVREIGTLSFHQPELRKHVVAYTEALRSYICKLFELAPRKPGLNAIESAQIVMALWMGLLTNVEYDVLLTDGVSRRLFRKMLFDLANLDDR